MEETIPSDLSAILIQICENSKRHEQMLADLMVWVEGLKKAIPDDRLAAYEGRAAEARFELSVGGTAQLRLLDATIRRLREE